MTASLLLVHGAGSGPWAFDGWTDAFDRVTVVACDLQAGLDPARACMRDYAGVVLETAAPLARPLALCGWSMGGLVALIAAADRPPDALVLLEPSPPAEVQGTDRSVEPHPGTFDPDGAYGTFPEGVPARPESSLARAERKRGISVPHVDCRSLVVYGDEFRDERGSAIAAFYGSDERHFPGFTHWDLVRRTEVRDAVAHWLAA